MSIALGLGRLADRVAFETILASGPEVFTVAKAAALGLAWGDIRALIGTNGENALIAEDGTICACPPTAATTGIIAELTAETAATIVGAWSMAAIAVAEDITLIAQKTGKNGDLKLTCWCNMEALLPTPGAFWKLGY
jgi:hypothetical protein